MDDQLNELVRHISYNKSKEQEPKISPSEQCKRDTELLGAQITQYYGELVEKVNNLDGQVNDILHRHENDFLFAFKSHMFSVYQQLLEVKQKTDEEEMKFQREARLNTMGRTLEWFKEESLKLNQTVVDLQKEVEIWKTKAKTLESDNKFLEKEYKSAKRQVNMLKVGLGQRTLEATANSAVDITRNLRSAPAGDINKSLDEIRNSSQFTDFLKVTYNTSEPALREIDIYINQQDKKFRETTRHYQKTLEAEKKKVKSLQAQRGAKIESKNELEALFIECVDEVRKNVLKRRQQVNSSARSSRGKTIDLTGSDKRQVIEMLISNESVLVLLYELLFPHKASAINEIANEFYNTSSSGHTDQPSPYMDSELARLLDSNLPDSETPRRQRPQSESAGSRVNRKRSATMGRKPVMVHNGKLLIAK